MKKILLVSFMLWVVACCTVAAQDFSLANSPLSVRFGLKTYQGLETPVAFGYEKTKKEWWKYIRKKAVLINKGEYYENKVQPKKKQSGEVVSFFSRIEEDKKQSKLIAALNTDGLAEEHLSVYRQFVADLILDFKVGLYADFFETYIQKQEKEARKVSKQLEKMEKKQRKLEASKEKKNANIAAIGQQMKANDTKMEKARVALFAHQKQIAHYKDELKKIR